MTKRIVLILALMLPAIAWAETYFQTIPPAEVLRIVKQPGVAILDVNVPEVWQKHHLPGAVHIDGPDLARYLPADKRTTLVFYCANPQCSASALAANESVMLGYRKVYVMPEGIFGWVRLGYPTQGSAQKEGMRDSSVLKELGECSDSKGSAGHSSKEMGHSAHHQM